MDNLKKRFLLFLIGCIGSRSLLVVIATSDQTKYRMAVGKLAWSLPCRPEMDYQIKELSRHLQEPRVLHVWHLCRVLKYLHKTQHWLLHLRCNDSFEDPILYADANWANDLLCKSTSGIILL